MSVCVGRVCVCVCTCTGRLEMNGLRDESVLMCWTWGLCQLLCYVLWVCKLSDGRSWTRLCSDVHEPQRCVNTQKNAIEVNRRNEKSKRTLIKEILTFYPLKVEMVEWSTLLSLGWTYSMANRGLTWLCLAICFPSISAHHKDTWTEPYWPWQYSLLLLNFFKKYLLRIYQLPRTL